MKKAKEKKFDVVGKRPDSVGLFWNEPAEIKVKAERIKREPPEPTWLAPDFIPHLDRALKWSPDVFTAEELWQAASNREKLIFDIEHYNNYFMVMFKSLESGKVIWFEKSEQVEMHLPTLQYMVDRFCLVGFNSINYDLPMLTLALAGHGFQAFNDAERMLIKDRCQPWEVLKHFKCRQLDVDHIDLINVAPLSGSLKIYGGRCHTGFMQDLPFPPGSDVNELKQQVLRMYCANDLQNTEDLHDELEPSLKLREMMGAQYGVELRSKSDAQIAEAVIKKEVETRTGTRPVRHEVMPFTIYHYQPPAYLQFKTDLLQWVLYQVAQTRFVVAESGNLPLPENLAALKFTLGETTYQMGIGGLHSCESNRAVFADSECFLIDYDVASYYPAIILNQGLYPEAIGPVFLEVYRKIVERRLEAKKAKNKLVADSLKITINGTFGKLGNKWSVMYSPRLLIQVTLTGQLSLLYLIEKIELAGIRVVSANTDGIVIKCPRSRRDELQAIVDEWERETAFDTESTEYHALLSRSVNDYMAVKTDCKVKGKGGLGRGITKLFKNPVNFICLTALENFLGKGIPIEKTINDATDIRDFMTVRTVQGGAVFQGEFLGKAIRWYYSNELTNSEIVYAKSGNKVPRSENARPLMELPDQVPADLNRQWYISEAFKMLGEAGYPVDIPEE